MCHSSIQFRQNRENFAADRVTFRSVGELEQLREAAAGASLDFIQLSRGRLQGEMIHLDLGLSSVHYNSFSAPVQGRGSLSPDRWTFLAFPACVSGVFTGVELASSTVLAYPPGSEFDGASRRGAYQDWGFTVDDSVLRHVVRHLFQRDLPIINRTCLALRPHHAALEGLLTLAKTSLGLPRVSAALDASRTLHEELAEQLGMLLMSGQTRAAKLSRRVVSHSRIVRMSIEYVSAYMSAPITLTQLCEIVDVSERTLRNAFQSVMGLSPNAYLKARRLQKVRSLLERSPPGAATVTEIAVSSGFRHLGHFSQDYVRFFGESPSKTLASAKAD